MTRQEHLLTILAEECNEVAHRVAKALRFGLHDVPPGETLTNEELINLELAHITAAAGLLMGEGVNVGRFDGEAVMKKRAAVEKWLLHAENQGTLTV